MFKRCMLGTFVVCAGVAAARPAQAVDCQSPPGVGEVIVYTDAYQGGSCSRLNASVGRYWTDQAIQLPDNWISSVWVGQQTRVDLYRDAWLSGPVSHFEGSPWGSDWVYGTIPNNDDASSIVVSLTDGVLTPFWFVGDYPGNTSAPAWSADAQGIAHSDDSWFLTQKTAIYRFPLGADIGDGGAFDRRLDFAALANIFPSFDWSPTTGFNHFGDPDFRNGFLFVPVEHSQPGNQPLLLILDDGLNPVAWEILNHATADASGKFNAAWVSVNSAGVLYTSGGRLDGSNGLQIYQVNFDAIPPNGHILDFLNQQILYHYAASVPDGPPGSPYVGSPTGPVVPASLAQIQGGDLADWDENLLYISNGCCNDDTGNQDWGLRAYDLRTGMQQVESSNGYGPFNFEFSRTYHQEPEGVDFFDMQAGVSPHIPTSQVHVILYSNASSDIWLKHYTF